MASLPPRFSGLGPVATGHGDSAEHLLPIVYEELRSLATRYLRRERADHTLQPTALVHEAYLRLSQQQKSDFDNPRQFFCTAATFMRRILVNHAKQGQTARRGNGRCRLELREEHTAGTSPPSLIIALDDALADLAKFDERKARVVELRYFAGFDVNEIADLLDISASTVKRDWVMAKTWLLREVSGDRDD